MEVHLTPQQEAFWDRNVRAGRFSSKEDALRFALDLLEEQERVLDDSRRMIDEADEDFSEGRYAVYTDESLGQLAEELKREARATLSGR